VGKGLGEGDCRSGVFGWGVRGSGVYGG